MARFVIAGSKGTDDPTMATLPFIASEAAHEQGHEVVLWLQAEAVVLAKKGMVDGIQGSRITGVEGVSQYHSVSGYSSVGVLNNNSFQGHIDPQARCILEASGRFKKSSSSKAAVIFARRAYFQYVSTEKWRERRWRLFSTVPLWVCSACAVARQIHEPDLEVGAVMKGMEDYVKAITECDRNLSF